MYPGNAIVDRSLALGEPLIYVSANYRVNGMQNRPNESSSHPLFGSIWVSEWQRSEGKGTHECRYARP